MNETNINGTNNYEDELNINKIEGKILCNILLYLFGYIFCVFVLNV